MCTGPLVFTIRLDALHLQNIINHTCEHTDDDDFVIGNDCHCECSTGAIAAMTQDDHDGNVDACHSAVTVAPVPPVGFCEVPNAKPIDDFNDNDDDPTHLSFVAACTLSNTKTKNDNGTATVNSKQHCCCANDNGTADDDFRTREHKNNDMEHQELDSWQK